ncbi:GfV-C4-ORF1 [Ichnoviriform fumiferanae]|uniref:GfV-C4-ORF1 n=1 Tax=Ichnoviriform fumiferanae TaxID=419435 RepID=A2PZW6_9VIRU|nr:GfV-C4-ORF1 [Ichnoviriform fumiferanae]BAF45538.1 GfV-C4-ORF1 [Ichnoviriform fumiferanae]
MSQNSSAAELARINNLVARILFCNANLTLLNRRVIEGFNGISIRTEIARIEGRKSILMAELRTLINNLPYVPHSAASVLR